MRPLGGSSSHAPPTINQGDLSKWLGGGQGLQGCQMPGLEGSSMPRAQ